MTIRKPKLSNLERALQLAERNGSVILTRLNNGKILAATITEKGRLHAKGSLQ